MRIFACCASHFIEFSIYVKLKGLWYENENVWGGNPFRLCL